MRAFKSLISFSLVLFLSISLSPSTLAATNTVINRSDKTISVAGAGRILAAPDTAVIHLNYSIFGNDIVDINAKKQAFLQQLRADLIDMGISSDDIRPVFRLSYGTPPDGNYVVDIETHTLTLVPVIFEKMRNMNMDSDITDISVSGSTSNVTYYIEDPSDLIEQARELALQDAEKNAKSLAKKYKVKLVEINTINETLSSYSYYDTQFIGITKDLTKEALAGFVPSDITFDPIPFTVNLNLTYRFK